MGFEASDETTVVAEASGRAGSEDFVIALCSARHYDPMGIANYESPGNT